MTRAMATGLLGPVRLGTGSPGTGSDGTRPDAPAETASWPGVIRGRIRADLIYLGWQPVQADPGPPPAPPGGPDLDEVSPAWVAAQRREQSRLSRPARLTAQVCLVLAAVDAVCSLMSFRLAVAAGLMVTGVAACAARRIWQGKRALAARLRQEQRRVARFREVQLTEYAARQQQYGHLHRRWQQRTAASWRQPRWRPVTLPARLRRIDVAGGTLAGWSALLTVIAVPRLASGGQVTVFDLTEGGVAADLIGVAARLGIDPAVWVLPADLASLHLGTNLGADVFADVLALTASDGHADRATDSALIARVLAGLGESVSMARILAALRALGQIGNAEQHLDQALSQTELTGLSTLAGRGAERIVVDRAWAIEARLRILGPMGTAPPVDSQLKVASLDRRAAAVGNATLAVYLTVAITAVLRQAPPSAPWQQTVVLLGAERLPDDIVDRLCDATESAGAGLVLGYRSIPPHVRERLGRGDSAVAFMRLGNAEEAKFAAEQIGTEHRLVLSQITDTVGTSITETGGDSYTSTVGDTGSDSLTLTAGRSRRDTFAPFGSASTDANASTSASVTEGISTGTSWGVSTSSAIGTSGSLAKTAQRSREFLVEQHELQHLPQSALVLCCGRQVVLADANPAIMALPTASLASR